MGINGAVIGVPAYMYHIADVAEAQNRRRQMRDDVPAIAHHIKTFEALLDIFTQHPEYDARTAKAVAADVIRYVGAVIYAIFVAQKRKRRSVGIARHYYFAYGTVKNIAFKVISCRLPDAEKAPVHIPPVFRVPVSLCGEVEVIAPIDYAVTAFKIDIQAAAARLAAERRVAPFYGYVARVQYAVIQRQQIFIHKIPLYHFYDLRKDFGKTGYLG